MKVSPSILTCDFGNLKSELEFVEKSGADMLHLDVMDGVFVPNLSFGPPVIERIRPLSALCFDVHLMMIKPHLLIESFAKAGADIINFHVESEAPIAETIAHIKALGKKAALTIKPKTPAEAVFPYLDDVCMILVMTVEPGFGGQSFMYDMMPKIEKLRAEIDRRALAVDIQVDGGVNAETAKIIADAGATIAVVGSALFNSEKPAELVRDIQAL